MIDEIGKLEITYLPFRFPIRGLCLESAAHEQPEQTTPSLRNVWIYDGGGIARGGQRAGTTTVWSVPGSASE